MQDEDLMRRALAQAERALYLSSPNPRVGCVLASADGVILGEGHTQRVGQAHAEVMALRDAAQRGHTVQGATAYVTLEPCSHQGKTGPCSQALIEAGVRRVVAAEADPNPLVAGRGLTQLHAAGIEVEVGLLAAQAHELNLGFFSRMQNQKPWVRLKVATSMDGKTALNNGISQWITSPQARADNHHWRARACAILTGIDTLLHDHARMDVREQETSRQPTLVVVDSQLRLTPDAPALQVSRPVWVYTTTAANAQRKAALESRGVHITTLGDATGRVDLRAMLRDLAEREINELHVEAGRTLNGALLQTDKVDEILLYLAPKLLGPGLELARLPEFTALSQAQNFEWTDHHLIGPDLRLRARRAQT